MSRFEVGQVVNLRPIGNRPWKPSRLTIGRRLTTCPTVTILLTVLPALAAVDGTITNATSGKSASGVSIALVEPGQSGMKTLGQTTSDLAGKFAFTESAQGPSLLQATYEGVTYSKMVMPGAPTSGLNVEIYDSTKKPVSKVAQHMILVQPTRSDLNISETFLLQGDPKLTYIDHDGGTLRLYIPPELKGTVSVQATGPGGMPVARPVQKTKLPNIYMVDYPIRPGETRLDFTYAVTASNPAVLEGKILHKDGKARLVVPNGVTAKGDGIADLGKEPRSQASIYDVTGPAYKVEITGTGSLQGPEAAPEEDTGAPQIQQAQPHIYNKMYWIMGLFFAILGLGTYLLVRE